MASFLVLLTLASVCTSFFCSYALGKSCSDMNCEFQNSFCGWKSMADESYNLLWTKGKFWNQRYPQLTLAGKMSGSKGRLFSPWVDSEPEHGCKLHLQASMPISEGCSFSLFQEVQETGNITTKRRLRTTSLELTLPWTNVEFDCRLGLRYRISYEGEVFREGNGSCTKGQAELYAFACDSHPIPPMTPKVTPSTPTTTTTTTTTTSTTTTSIPSATTRKTTAPSITTRTTTTPSTTITTTTATTNGSTTTSLSTTSATTSTKTPLSSLMTAEKESSTESTTEIAFKDITETSIFVEIQTPQPTGRIEKIYVGPVPLVGLIIIAVVAFVGLVSFLIILKHCRNKNSKNPEKPFLHAYYNGNSEMSPTFFRSSEEPFQPLIDPRRQNHVQAFDFPAPNQPISQPSFSLSAPAGSSNMAITLQIQIQSPKESAATNRGQESWNGYRYESSNRSYASGTTKHQNLYEPLAKEEPRSTNFYEAPANQKDRNSGIYDVIPHDNDYETPCPEEEGGVGRGGGGGEEEEEEEEEELQVVRCCPPLLIPARASSYIVVENNEVR